jgi:kumamolisin
VLAAMTSPYGSPTVISISWGSSESYWAAQDMDALDQLFQTAAAKNITVCVASGDNGSADGSPDGSDTADFPASSPHVLGCGGTSFGPNGEVAWNNASGATGGGFSAHFQRPSYQSGDQWRGVPDVCGDADPETGYNIQVNGVAMVSGGTSAVAPLWSALVALANQQLQRQVGFINPTLYANPAALTDITSGNNGGYSATVGWDAVTGLGSPRGVAVVTALSR